MCEIAENADIGTVLCTMEPIFCRRRTILYTFTYVKFLKIIEDIDIPLTCRLR